MDAGLRQIPLAALHDGKQFLVEKYSLGSIPSFSLTDTTYQSLKGSPVLAMGASEFPDPTLDPLPFVPIELSNIVKQHKPGEYFLNQQFTLDNLKNKRRQKQFGIVHLATHASFLSNGSQSPYIQLWDRKLRLDELRQVQWYAPPTVELLVLSACETAVGDEKAEMGFAGLAVQAGVKSALASFWQVSDEGTLTLMSEFYQQLGKKQVTTKAEALRRAQLAMLHGKQEKRQSQNLSHPYYWAGFTMIGSPW